MLSAVVGILMLALPPPPGVVVRETRYYGTVTIDHGKHLALRVTCKNCHGAGPVSKLTFTPKIAHDRCIGCHKEQTRGPTSCKGCHVKPVEPVAPTLMAQPGAAPEEGAGKVTTMAALSSMAGTASRDAGGAPAPIPLPPPPEGPLPRERFTRVLQLGCTAGDALGPAVRLSSRQRGVAVDYSFERIGGGRDARTLVLFGAGLARELAARWNVLAGLVGGVDTATDPATAFMPAVGARAGVEWLPRKGLFHSVHLSLTGVVDVANREVMGQEIGGAHVYGTIATGIALPGKSKKSP